MNATTVPASIYNFKIHPLAKLFPPLSPDEFKKLKSDIERRGLLEALTVSDDGKTLLDGINRLRACEELKIPLITNRFSLVADSKRMTEADYIWSKNFMRRHLTDDQRAMLAVQFSDAEKEAAKQRQREHGGTAPGQAKDTSGGSAPSERTRAALAGKHQVSEHKIRQAETVALKAPHLSEKVAHGEMKLKDAEKAITPAARPASDAEPFRVSLSSGWRALGSTSGLKISISISGMGMSPAEHKSLELIGEKHLLAIEKEFREARQSSTLDVSAVEKSEANTKAPVLQSPAEIGKAASE
jgi:ParB-like chromosome segregation protein Spo0J